MIDAKYYKFNPTWMLEVLDRAAQSDSFLRSHPETVWYLQKNLPRCRKRLKETRRHPDFERKVNFYFVSRENPNQPGSEWQFGHNITVHGDEADFIVDVMKDGSIGAIEVWLKKLPPPPPKHFHRMSHFSPSQPAP